MTRGVGGAGGEGWRSGPGLLPAFPRGQHTLEPRTKTQTEANVQIQRKNNKHKKKKKKMNTSKTSDHSEKNNFHLRSEAGLNPKLKV